MPDSPAPLLLLSRRLLSDQLTPVLAYRRLVAPDDRAAPSFLFESVENGTSVGRWSMLGAQPALEVVARAHAVTVHDRRAGTRQDIESPNPLEVVRTCAGRLAPHAVDPMPEAFHGGWVGYCGFDAVRYLEPGKLPFSRAPRDDRRLPDVHFGLYRQVAVFDHVAKLVHAVIAVPSDEHASEAAAIASGRADLDAFCGRLIGGGPALAPGSGGHRPGAPPQAARAKLDDARRVYGRSWSRPGIHPRGRCVSGCAQPARLERTTSADPFDIYRALRVVNPSPYQIYLQAAGAFLSQAAPRFSAACAVAKW
jgi:anthranilate synthase component 1